MILIIVTKQSDHSICLKVSVLAIKTRISQTLVSGFRVEDWVKIPLPDKIIACWSEIKLYNWVLESLGGNEKSFEKSKIEVQRIVWIAVVNISYYYSFILKIGQMTKHFSYHDFTLMISWLFSIKIDFILIILLSHKITTKTIKTFLNWVFHSHNITTFSQNITTL